MGATAWFPGSGSLLSTFLAMTSTRAYQYEKQGPVSFSGAAVQQGYVAANVAEGIESGRLKLKQQWQATWVWAWV